MTELRPLSAEMQGPVEDFFARVPESDHNSFAEDVFAPGTVSSWLQDTRGRRSVALDGDHVVGYVAILPMVGWSLHVGSLRVVVDVERRGQASVGSRPGLACWPGSSWG